MFSLAARASEFQGASHRQRPHVLPWLELPTSLCGCWVSYAGFNLCVLCRLFTSNVSALLFNMALCSLSAQHKLSGLCIELYLRMRFFCGGSHRSSCCDVWMHIFHCRCLRNNEFVSVRFGYRTSTPGVDSSQGIEQLSWHNSLCRLVGSYIPRAHSFIEKAMSGLSADWCTRRLPTFRNRRVDSEWHLRCAVVQFIFYLTRTGSFCSPTKRKSTCGSAFDVISSLLVAISRTHTPWIGSHWQRAGQWRPQWGAITSRITARARVKATLCCKCGKVSGAGRKVLFKKCLNVW